MALCVVAAAQETAETPPETEPEVIEILPVPPLPSALDTLAGAAAAERKGGEDGAALPKIGVGALVRGRWSVHPVLDYLSLAGSRGGRAMGLGGALGHQLWTLDGLPLQLALVSRLEATAPVAGARGVRVDLQSAVGPWVGPIGLQVGPVLRFDQQSWSGGAELEPALTLGVVVGAVANVGPLHPRVAVIPAGIVAGDRGAADRGQARFPVLLDETTCQLGLLLDAKPLGIGADAAFRETVAGSAFELGVSLHLSVF